MSRLALYQACGAAIEQTCVQLNQHLYMLRCASFKDLNSAANGGSAAQSVMCLMRLQ